MNFEIDNPKISPYVYPGLEDIATEDKQINNIIRVVTRHYDITRGMLFTKSRKYPLPDARYVVMYILYKTSFKLTGPLITRMFMKDHAVIIHGNRKINDLRETNSDFRKKFNAIQDDLNLNI